MRLTAYPWAILAILLLATPSAAAPEATPPNSSELFQLHKANGDRARLSQRWQEAIDEYDQALAIRFDAEVTGHAGIVLAGLGRFDLATPLLQRAATDPSAPIPATLRKLFFDEFLRSSDQVCRVDVHVDQANARVVIDATQVVQGRSDFHVFLNPGVHTFVAEKPGYHDVVQTLFTDRACKRNVALIMQSVPIEQLLVDNYKRVVQKNFVLESDVRESGELPRALHVAKPPPNPYEPSWKRWFVGGVGLWIPFYATPGWGIGPYLHAGARVHRNFEIGLETKVALHLVTMTTNAQIKPLTMAAWSFGATACGRFFDFAFFCGIPQLNFGVRLNSDRERWWRLGLGGRLGLEFHRTNSQHWRIFGDFAGFGGAFTSVPSSMRLPWDGNWAVMSLGASVTYF